MELGEAFGTAGSGTTKLYRAVSQAEFEQLMSTGRFEAGPNALEGKFFAESVQDAATWGEALEGPGRYRIVEVELPTDVANNFMRWAGLDGIGPARYGEFNQLQDVVIRQCRHE